MQRFKLKIILFSFFLLTLSRLSFGNPSDDYLSHADSLFEGGKYTEAFEMYKKLLVEYQRYTPKMLLRMAYIQEGLEDYPRSLYYLNLYYTYQADNEVLQKMAELAEKRKLSGYQFTDYEFFLSIYHRYFNLIAGVGLGLLIALAGLIGYQHSKKSPTLPTAVTFLLLAGLLFYLFNFTGELSKGIISENHVLVMKAPSAGSDKLDLVDAGHRVEVLGKQDIWYKVKWKEEIGYIRESNLLVIR